MNLEKMYAELMRFITAPQESIKDRQSAGRLIAHSNRF